MKKVTATFPPMCRPRPGKAGEGGCHLFRAAGLCLLALALGGAESLPGEVRWPADELATVNGQPISRGEFDARLVRHFGELVRDRFVIFEKFVEQSMAARSLSVPDEEVDARLAALSDESLREEGKTLEEQLAERAASPKLLRYLVRLELALYRMVREDYHIPAEQPIRQADVIKWFRSARVRIPVQRYSADSPSGLIVRVGPEEVPHSHAAALLYLAFPRAELERLLREMAGEQLVDQLAKVAAIQISPQQARREAARSHREEPLLERISLEEILKIAASSPAAAEARARQQLQVEALLRRTLSEDDLKHQFEAHPDWYLGRTVRLSQIFIGRIEPQTGRLRDEAERAEAVQKLQTIRKELDGWGDFAKLAFAYSEDLSALREGDVGYFPRSGVLGEALNPPALGLKKGEVAGPIESPFGYHLIKATEVQKRGGRSFEEARVRERVADDLIRERLPAWWAEQLQKAQITLFPDRF